MVNWDQEAPADTTPIKALYFCINCEEFFEKSIIASNQCPFCWSDPRYIVGPVNFKYKNGSKVIDSRQLYMLIKENKRKYGHAQRR